MLRTKNFGDVQIPIDKVIHMAGGIPGLPCMSQCFLIKVEETLPIYWLQSAQDGDVALPVVDPFIIDPAYSPALEDSLFQELELTGEGDLLVVAVAVIPKDIRNITVNLAAPVVLNIEKNIGRQVVLENTAFPMRKPAYDAICLWRKEEAEHAGVDQEG